MCKGLPTAVRGSRLDVKWSSFRFRCLAHANALQDGDTAAISQSLKALCQGTLASAWKTTEGLIASGHLAEGLALLIESAAEKDDVRIADRLCLRLLALEEAGKVEVPLSVWQALVGLHARSGDTDAAFALLGRVESACSNSGEKDVQVPLEAFESLIGGLVESRRIRAAFDTFQRMRTWALLEPSPHLYAIMIRASGIARDPEKALNLFEEVKQSGSPSPEIRAALVIALASQKRTERLALQTFHEAVRKGDGLHDEVCRVLASVCARSGLAEETKLLQRRMRAANVLPDATTRADFIRAFGVAAARAATSAEQVQLLSHAWREIRAAKEAGVLSPDILNALVSAYCACGLVEHAENLLGLYPGFNCTPDAQGYEIVLEALKGKPPQFRRMWEAMIGQTALTPSTTILESALEIAVKDRDGQWVHRILQLMFEAKVHPKTELVELIRSMPLDTIGKLNRQLLSAFERLKPS